MTTIEKAGFHKVNKRKKKTLVPAQKKIFSSSYLKKTQALKISLGKIFLKSLHAGDMYEIRKNSLLHGEISKLFFLGHFSPKIVLLCTYSILRVKKMVE